MVAQSKVGLEIVTPKGRALGIEADEVNAPSVDGEFGILPGHLPMLASLRAGIVSYRDGSEWKRCAVGAGFVEVASDRVLLLTDEFTERPAIDPVIVRKELADVQADIQKTETLASDPRATEAVARLRGLIERENWLAAQLELYGDPPPPTMRPYEEYGPAPIDETAGEPGAETTETGGSS
ncbi:MAG TPA: ATP synthase F1 subunit epsilon [Polyangiaceae bacterium]|nr:ATP synthase F1 subunit epsilon [Polyangiaceae bacterium]